MFIPSINGTVDDGWLRRLLAAEGEQTARQIRAPFCCADYGVTVTASGLAAI